MGWVLWQWVTIDTGLSSWVKRVVHVKRDRIVFRIVIVHMPMDGVPMVIFDAGGFRFTRDE